MIKTFYFHCRWTEQSGMTKKVDDEINVWAMASGSTIVHSSISSSYVGGEVDIYVSVTYKLR